MSSSFMVEQSSSGLKVKEVGKCFSHGNVTFASKYSLKTIECQDYTLILQGETNIDTKHVPYLLKPSLDSRWLYVMHHSPLLFPSVETKTLQQRVKGGELIAHTDVLECSMEGNPFVYFGFLPTIQPKKYLEGSHNTCRLPCSKKWPRALFIFIKQDKCLCPCSKECGPMWLCRLSDYTNVKSYCVQKIPWDKLYIIMGDTDESSEEGRKRKRSCNVCDQCRRCGKSTARCRAHIICKHNSQKRLPIKICKAKIKDCMKYRQGFNG